MKLKTSCEKYRNDIDEESLTEHVLVFAFHSDATLGHLRYAEQTERLNRHRVALKRSFCQLIS